MSDEDVAYARFLARSERLSLAAIASKMEVGKTTVWRAVSRGQVSQMSEVCVKGSDIASRARGV